MILKSLRLKNFRCYKELSLDFDENLIVFVGNNGSGKTSIFEAIFYALFGFGHSLERGGKDYIVFDGASEILCEIELVFNLDELDYKLLRRIKGSNLNVEAFLYRGDNSDHPIAERDSGVTKEIERLLGMTYQTFKISVFSAQKDLDAFTELQPEKRKEEIRKLLNLGIIKEGVGLIRRDARDIEVSIDTLRAQILDIAKLDRDLQDFLIKEKDKTKRLKILESTIHAIRKQLDEVRKAGEDLSKTRDKVQKLEAQIEKKCSLREEKQTELANIRNKIKDLNKKKQYLEKNKSIRSEYLKLQSEYEELNQLAIKKETEQNLQKRLIELTNKLRNFTQKEEELSKKLEPLKSFEEEKIKVERAGEQKNFSINKLNGEIAKLEESISSIVKEKNKINEEIERIKKMGRNSPCPKCGRPLGDHYDSLLKKLITQLSDKNAEREKLTIKQKNFVNELSKEEAIVKALKERESEVDKFIRALDSSKGELNNVIIEKNRTKEEIKMKEDGLSKLGKLEFNKEYWNKVKTEINLKKPVYEKFISLEGEIKSLTGLVNEEVSKKVDLNDLQIEIDELLGERKSIDFEEDKYRQHKQKQQDLENKYEGLLKNQGNFKSDVTKLKSEIEQIEKEIKKQENLKKEIQLKEEELIQLTRLEALLVEFEQYLLVRIRPILEFKASELVKLMTKGKYVSLELDENYTPYLYDLSERYDLKRFSGGEQDLVNLCLRIAVSDIVAERAGGRRINFLILDEIFASQDEDRRRQILNTLQELTSQFRQIFLITYVEDLKEMMPIVYQVKEITHHNSVVQLV